MKVLDTYTKKFLVIIAVLVLGWEIASVVSSLQLITDSMAELSCQRPWISLVIGALMGHFFWPNPRLVDLVRKKANEANARD